MRWTLFLLLAVVALGYWARGRVAEWAIVHVAPGPVSAAIGQPVTIGGARFRESAGGELVIDLEDVSVGTESDATFHAQLRQIRVHLTGWAELTDGLTAVRRIRVDGGAVFLPPAPPSPPDAPPFPDLTLPDSLPGLPFPIEIGDVAVRHRTATGETISGQVRGSILPIAEASVDDSTSPVSILLDVDGIEGLVLSPPLDAIAVKSITVGLRRTARGLEEMTLRTRPVSLAAEGALLLDERRAAYDGRWKLTFPGGTGSYGVRLPVKADGTASSADTAQVSVVGTLDITEPQRLLERADLDLTLPSPLQLAATLGMSPEAASLTGELRVAEETLDLRAEASRDDWQVTARSSGLDLGAFSKLYEIPTQPRGSARGTVTARKSDTADSNGVVITADLTLTQGRVELDGRDLGFDTLTVDASWERGSRVDLRSLTIELFGGTATVEGTVATDLSTKSTLEATFEDWQLSRSREWIGLARSLDGTVSGTASLKGRWDNPDYEVRATLTEGTAAFDGYSGRFRDVNAIVEANRSKVELSELSAALGGGMVTGTATWNLEVDPGQPPTFGDVRAELDLERVRLIRTRDFWLRGSGSVQLFVPLEETSEGAPSLSADLVIDRGVYDRNVYPRIQDRASLPFDLFSIEEGLFSRMQFDVRAGLNGGFLVRNNVLDVAPHGELRLGGTGSQPVLTGRVSSTDGRVILPHLSLAIERAEVTFPQDDPFRPTLDFVGSGKAAGVEIEAVATGALMEPEVVFSSVPYLEQEDLLLLVATGRLRTQLEDEGVERVAALEVARLYGPEIWERIFGRSRGESLLDRVTITTAPGGEGGDRITVEVRLLDWLSAVGERDDRGDLNLDFEVFHWFR
ncbi:MAG: translocation/assembly module TamB domain-containing protein [Planctomycetota bacterium]